MILPRPTRTDRSYTEASVVQVYNKNKSRLLPRFSGALIAPLALLLSPFFYRPGARATDYAGGALWFHSGRATEYFSRWIELKETAKETAKGAAKEELKEDEAASQVKGRWEPQC
jgi:hypothetical protein